MHLSWKKKGLCFYEACLKLNDLQKDKNQSLLSVDSIYFCLSLGRKSHLLPMSRHVEVNCSCVC